MKIKIESCDFQKEFTGTFTVQLKDDTGAVILTTTRGFTSTKTDPEEMKGEIEKALSNIKDQYVNEKNSVAKQEMLKMVGKEFEVRLDAAAVSLADDVIEKVPVK